MRDGSVDRQCDWSDFGRRPKPQVDPLDIAVLGPLLHELDETPTNPDRGFAGLLPGAVGKARRIEQKEEVDVGGIIELVAPKLSHRDDRKTSWFGVGQPFRDRCADRLVDRTVGKIGKQAGNLFERQFA